MNNRNKRNCNSSAIQQQCVISLIGKIFILIFFIQLIVFSQNSFAQITQDSIEKQLDKALRKDDVTQALNLLEELYTESKTKSPMLSLEYAGQALQLAKENKDTLKMASLYNFLGDIYFEKETYYLSMEYYMKAYEIYAHRDDSTEIANSFTKIGNTYMAQNVLDIALDYYHKATEFYRAIKNKLGLAIAYDMKGVVYTKLENEELAIGYFRRALELHEKNKNNRQIARTNLYLTELYLKMELFAEAKDCLQKSLNINTESNYEKELAESYFLFGELYELQEDFPQAISFYRKAQNIYNILRMKELIVESQNKEAWCNYKLKNYNEAITILEKGLEISYQYDFLKNKEFAYNVLAEIYSAKSDYKSAYYFQKHLSNMKDSIADSRKEIQFYELQVSLETQKQEKQIELMKQEQALLAEKMRLKDILSLTAFIAIAFFIAFVIYLYISLKNMRKVNRTLWLKNKEINQQKLEIQEQSRHLENANKAISQQKREIELQNENMNASIAYASRIQNAMLPAITNFNNIFQESFVLWKPKDVVSGDFYWITEKKLLKKVIIAAVDCTGHGIPGAFMSMLGDSYLNLVVNTKKITHADEILNALHKYIRKALNQERGDNRDGMEMSICVIDKVRKTLEFAGASSPLIYIQDNELFQIKGDAKSIGGIQREKERHFTRHTIAVNKPTYVYMFSDGYLDQFGGDSRQKFLRQPFNKMLFENHKKPMIEQHKILEQTIENWRGEIPQIDDILVLGYKISLPDIA